MYDNFDNSLVHYYPMAVMLLKDVVLVFAMTIVILITPASSQLYFSSPNLTSWINAKKVYFLLDMYIGRSEHLILVLFGK